MSDSDLIKTKEFFTKAYPNITSKNLHTQLGVHFEEIFEMIQTITGTNPQSAYLITIVGQANRAMSIYLKEHDKSIEVKPENREEFLDGLCDQIVTATGVAHIFGMDIVGGFGEVNRSNLSKFDENGDPILDSNLKVVKGPHYFKPNLKPFV